MSISKVSIFPKNLNQVLYVFCTKDKFKFDAKLIFDNLYVSGPEWFLFLYFKYWYFRSLKRFWDCDFNFVNVLESFDLVFHFGFNQNKLWTNWRILDHVSDAYVACVGLFGHLFWNKRSFWQQCQIIGRWPTPNGNPGMQRELTGRSGETFAKFWEKLIVNNRPLKLPYPNLVNS